MDNLCCGFINFSTISELEFMSNEDKIINEVNNCDDLLVIGKNFLILKSGRKYCDVIDVSPDITMDILQGILLHAEYKYKKIYSEQKKMLK